MSKRAMTSYSFIYLFNQQHITECLMSPSILYNENTIRTVMIPHCNYFAVEFGREETIKNILPHKCCDQFKYKRLWEHTGRPSPNPILGIIHLSSA